VDKNVEEIMGFPQVFWRSSFAQFRCPLVENCVDNVKKLGFLIQLRIIWWGSLLRWFNFATHYDIVML